jgi:Questin oxidase-like
MTSNDAGILDEAYERFHGTGPEFDDAMSNHGPMAVEAMVRHGHDRDVHAWIDWYQQRLEEPPRGLTPVTRDNWQEALGDPKRLGDWTTFMLREVQLRPWREILAEWWPRLLPGITTGATHGVIRLGHSVRALLAEEQSALATLATSPAISAPVSESAHADDPHIKESALSTPSPSPVISASASEPAFAEHPHSDESALSAPSLSSAVSASISGAVSTEGPRIEEFAHALAYWAARWSSLNIRVPAHSGGIGASAALAEIPSVAEQRISVSHRLEQLSGTPGWSATLGALRAPETPQQAAELLGTIVDAAVLDYLAHGHANPVMLVHASTAPTAVLRTLPALPESLWIPSLDAAWLATAVITAAYRNTEASPEDIAAALAQTDDPQETFDRAVRHRDEHAVKFADAAFDSFARTADKQTLAAATRATLLIKAP